MAKKFDIYTTGGVKNYDICLNRRAAIYDIIVHTLPFHYNEAARNEVILNSYVRNSTAHSLISGKQISIAELGGHAITEKLKKHEKAFNTVGIVSKARESIAKSSTPVCCTMQVGAKLDSTGKRRRLLYEMDAGTLSIYDDMSLNDVDYVII